MGHPVGMTFNATKSTVTIFSVSQDCKTGTRHFFRFYAEWLLCCSRSSFDLRLKLNVNLNVVGNCKYLGYFISSVNDDYQDIARHMNLLYATANMLIRSGLFTSEDLVTRGALQMTIYIQYTYKSGSWKWSAKSPGNCETPGKSILVCGVLPCVMWWTQSKHNLR